MSAFVFPFSSPSPSETPLNSPNPVTSPEIPQSPNPDTLRIRNNPFNYLVANKQSTGDTNLFQSASTPQHSTIAPQSTNPFDNDARMTFPTIPPKAYQSERTNSAFEHSNGRRLASPNPFLDDHALDYTPPPKPWITGRSRRGSETSSITSSSTFHTATPAALPNPYPHRAIPNKSQASLTNTLCTRRDIASSLHREIRLQETAKRYDRKLALERAKDEVRRLDPSASASRLSLLPNRTLASRIKDYKNPIPKLLRNGIFWCALLLFQTGIVSTGAAFAIIFTNKQAGHRISVGTGTIFWLVCSVAGLLIGAAGMIVMCMRKGNACLRTQDKLGFDEIRDFRDGDVEMGRGGGLLYLGVGERDDRSVLGGSPVREDNTVRWVRHRDGMPGEWVTRSGSARVEHSFKDPIWRDLYLTPTPSRFGGSVGSPEPGARSKLRYDALSAEDHKDPDIGLQRLKPTTRIRVSGEGEREIPTRDGAESRMGFRRHKDDGTDSHSMEAPKKSMQSEETLNDWTDAVGKEIHTWSPLDRLGRALSGAKPAMGAKPKQQKKIDEDEGMEMADLDDADDKAEAEGAKDGKVGKGIKWVSEQVAEYHGMWSPEIIQQRMKKRQEEKEKERLKQLQAEKTKVEGVNVRERARQFEGESQKTQENGLFTVGEESED